MKHVLRAVVFAIAAVGLAACVKQVWKVTYSGPGDYSSAHALTVGNDGTSFIAGFIESGELFVASYDANGNRLWDQIIEASQAGNNLSVGKTLALDSAGAIYLAAMAYPSATTSLLKFNAVTGEPLLSKELDNSYMFTDLQVGADGALYLSGYYGVAAYSPNGDFLWSYLGDNAASGAVSGRELENYPVRSVTDMSPAVADFASWNGNRHLKFVAGRLFALVAGELVEIDSEGRLLQQISLEELGLSSIDSIEAPGDSIVLIGTDVQGTVSMSLDLDFNLQQRNELQMSRFDGMVVSGNSEHVCIAMVDNVAGLTTVQLLESNGTARWSVSISQHLLHSEFINVLASGADCYLSALVTSDQNVIETNARRIDGKGQIIDAISLPHFVGACLAVQDKNIFHAGIFQANNAASVKAALIKHQRY